jgi:ketosteroid isomerase-like protein
VMLPGEKSPVKDTGKFIEIRRKEPNGSWLILRDFWNSDLAPGR